MKVIAFGVLRCLGPVGRGNFLVLRAEGQQLMSLREEGGFVEDMMGWFGEFKMISEQQ